MGQPVKTAIVTQLGHLLTHLQAQTVTPVIQVIIHLPIAHITADSEQAVRTAIGIHHGQQQHSIIHLHHSRLHIKVILHAQTAIQARITATREAVLNVTIVLEPKHIIQIRIQVV